MFGKQKFYVNARAIIERETVAGREVLLQERQKPGEARLLEFPGGQLELFEGITDALRREVREETGLTITAFLDAVNETRNTAVKGEVQCLTPSFVYQTLRGQVDSVGFFFRVTAEGSLTRQGDHAGNHQWLSVENLRERFTSAPSQFDWLTQGALAQYLKRGNL